MKIKITELNSYRIMETINGFIIDRKVDIHIKKFFKHENKTAFFSLIKDGTVYIPLKYDKARYGRFHHWDIPYYYETIKSAEESLGRFIKFSNHRKILVKTCEEK